MEAIGLFSLIYGLTGNSASTTCLDPGQSSSCYYTTISDDIVYCYGYASCFLTEIYATSIVKCDGSLSCVSSDEIEASSGSVLCNILYIHAIIITIQI